MKKKNTLFPARGLNRDRCIPLPSCCHSATPAERIMPFKCSCPSATERRTTAAKRDDFHSKSLLLVKNKGQWNARSGPKAAYGNFAMRTKFSERLDSK